MKRWNQKGSVHAKRRMAELRDRQRYLLKRELIAKLDCITGQRFDWWGAAQASGLRSGCGVEASIGFLRSEIERRAPEVAI